MTDKIVARSTPIEMDATRVRNVTTIDTGWQVSIPGIELGECLGRGGMAVVFKGFDKGFTPPRDVAVKFIHPMLSSNPGFRARFDHEAATISTLYHANIVPVFASGEAEGSKYLVMRYLAGGTLAARIAAGTLTPASILQIGAKLASALAYCHERVIFHRDFKPANVLFADDGTPMLADFGVAWGRPTEELDQTGGGTICGSPDYMPTEQLVGMRVTDRADMFSFGVTLFEMLAGRLPPPEVRNLQGVSRRSAVAELLPGVSSRLVELICGCLQAQPVARPSAQQCQEVLETEMVLVASGAANKGRAGDKAERKAISARMVLAVGAAAAAAIVIVVAAKLASRVDEPAAEPPVSARVPVVPVVDRNKAQALLKTLGVESSPLSPAATYSDDELRTILGTAPRNVTLGSTDAQLRDALQLCRATSKDCSVESYADESIRMVLLAPFELDRTAVSVKEFRQFVMQTGYRTEAETSGLAYSTSDGLLKPVKGGSWRNGVVGASPPGDLLAVVGVTFRDANAYCKWRNARLPTEDEWEYVARGPAGSVFPWGDDASPARVKRQRQPLVADGPSEGIGGSYRGMSGSVWEWVNTKVGERRVLKGGSWLENNVANRRAAVRRYELASRADQDSGFRCARAVDQWPDADMWLKQAM